MSALKFDNFVIFPNFLTSSSSPLPMIIQIHGQSDRFGSKKLKTLSKNYGSGKFEVLFSQILI